MVLALYRTFVAAKLGESEQCRRPFQAVGRTAHLTDDQHSHGTGCVPFTTSSRPQESSIFSRSMARRDWSYSFGS